MAVLEHTAPANRTIFVMEWLAAGGDLDTIARALGVTR